MKVKQRHFAEAGYVPKFYGYARVSHKNQSDRGTSIADQETRIRAYFEMLKAQEGQPALEWGGVHIEPVAQSAYSKTFPNRPAGKELKAILRPSDQVCVEKFDRIFRDLEDFAIHRRWFKERGIGFHIVSFFGNAFDANSQLADMILPIFAGLGEMESTIKSERMLLARSSRRAEGRHAGTAPPFFCQVVDNEPGKKAGGRLVLKDWAEVVCEKIIFLYDREGLSFMAISKVLMKDMKLNMRLHKVQDLYAFWKRWNRLSRPDINTFKMREFIDEFWRENPDVKPGFDNPFGG